MHKDLLFYVAIAFVMIVAAVAIVPSDKLTGNAVAELDACGLLGCSELCEPTTGIEKGDCLHGLVCCPTTWEGGAVGLCDLASNCPIIAEYSAGGGSLERFTAARHEEARTIQNIGWSTFWLPLLIAFIIAAGVIFLTKKKDV